MFKRLVVGLIKGLLIGAVIGAAFHFGLGLAVLAGLGGYLIAMAAGATAGVLNGKPPWRQAIWIESVLKAVFGLGVGALAFWAASKYAAFPLPFAIPGVEEGTPWTSLPILVAPAVAAVYGSLIELDNTDEDEDESGGGSKVRARVAVDDEAAYVEEAAGSAERGL